MNAKDGSVKGSFTYPRDSKIKYTVNGNLVKIGASVKFYGSAMLKKPYVTFTPVTAE